MRGKRTATILVALSLCLALIAPVGVAWGYFTSYASTRGSVPISLGTSTDITEEFNNWTKTVSVSNTGTSPVFVRVQAFGGSDYTLTYSGDELWTPGADGFYYYGAPVEAGQKTPDLQVKIGNVPTNIKEGTEFNIIVVYESTLALYDDNGEAYANWDNILDNGSLKGGEPNE